MTSFATWSPKLNRTAQFCFTVQQNERAKTLNIALACTGYHPDGWFCKTERRILLTVSAIVFHGNRSFSVTPKAARSAQVPSRTSIEFEALLSESCRVTLENVVLQQV